MQGNGQFCVQGLMVQGEAGSSNAIRSIIIAWYHVKNSVQRYEW